MFERDSEDHSTKNALLYQDILRYGSEHPFSDGFRFTELANWLMDNNLEFYNYYTDSLGKVSKSNRVAQRRQRIQACIDNLVTLRLLYVEDHVEALRNKEKTNLYDFTIAGYLLAWLVRNARYEDSNKSNSREKTESSAVHNILDIVNSCASNIRFHGTAFITKLFQKCNESGRLSEVFTCFVQTFLATGSTLEVYDGLGLMRIFLGLEHLVVWLRLAGYRTFCDTVLELNEETKKILFFQLKLEIEQHYELDHSLARGGPDLVRESQGLQCSDLVAPSEEWEVRRISNINDYLKVTVPGSCYKCNSERVLQVDIENYIKIATTSRSLRSKIGKCVSCGGTVSALMYVHLMN